MPNISPQSTDKSLRAAINDGNLEWLKDMVEGDISIRMGEEHLEVAAYRIISATARASTIFDVVADTLVQRPSYGTRSSIWSLSAKLEASVNDKMHPTPTEERVMGVVKRLKSLEGKIKEPSRAQPGLVGQSQRPDAAANV